MVFNDDQNQLATMVGGSQPEASIPWEEWSRTLHYSHFRGKKKFL